MIDPIAFRLGPFMIHWYGIILTSAMLLGIFLAGRQAVKQQIDPEHIYNLGILLIPLSVIGARIYYDIQLVLLQIKSWRDHSCLAWRPGYSRRSNNRSACRLCLLPLAEAAFWSDV